MGGGQLNFSIKVTGDSIGNPLRGLHLGELSSYDDVFSLSKNGELHPEN